MTTTPSPSPRAGLSWPLLLLLVCALVMWGSAFAGIRAALSAYPPGQLALVRIWIAALVLLVYGVCAGMRMPCWRDVPLVAATGLSGIAGYHILLNYGEQTVSAGAASLIISLSPMFAALLSVWWLHERHTRWMWLGMAIAFAGACIIASGEAGGLRMTGGAVYILLAALCGGFFIVAQKPLLQRYDALEVTTYAMLAGAVMLLVYVRGITATIARAPWPATLAVIYLGVCPAAVAYLIWTHVIARVTVMRAASFLYLIPLAAMAIGFVWLDEVPGVRTVLGGALTLGGVLLVNYSSRRLAKRDIECHHEREAQ